MNSLVESEEKFNANMQKGYDDVVQGRIQPLKEAFAQIQEMSADDVPLVVHTVSTSRFLLTNRADYADTDKCLKRVGFCDILRNKR